MRFKQFYLGCLAHASYLIGSEGEAAVVDPQRDVDQYIAEAADNGFNIKYVIETHLHADFVSGHRELAARTGAEIVFGAKAGAAFPHLAVKDGDVLKIGKAVLRILETPGHTPESISILVSDSESGGEPQKILTGDTLFIGDVGRPDLVGAKGYSPDAMAEMLYDSLHEKLLALPDETEVYPAHGAGSLCGRNISKDKSSTIGRERSYNYALQIAPREEFVRVMTTDLPEAPSYFSRDAELNRMGAQTLKELPALAALTAQETNKLLQQGRIALDVRSAAAFGTGHVPGAINIGLNGQFAPWAGAALKADQPLIIVAQEEVAANEAMTRLARVGLENVVGYLDGGMYAWDKAGLEIETLDQIAVDELYERLKKDPNCYRLIDVRAPGEYSASHIPNAENIPLPQLMERLSEIQTDKPIAINCAGGYRSSLASSLLLRHGIKRIYNAAGGFSAWKSAGLPCEPIKEN